MLENPSSTTSLSPPESAAVKRYAPPNQRNRSLNRRKSGDWVDQNNGLFANDAEKNQQHLPSRNIPVVDQVDVKGSSLLHENFHPGLIALEGCCRSEASQLLTDRWALAMHNYNDPSIDLSERPVMYSGSGASAWGHFRLPHQIMSQAHGLGPSSGSQMDFLSELHRSIQNASTKSDN